MKIIEKIAELRAVLNAHRRAGERIGFVPTMGNLHEGHLDLIRLARSTNNIVVCSIFVNPLQFGQNEDLDKYPRTFEADCQKLRANGCDYLLFPSVEEMYPNGMAEQTRVSCKVMTGVLCGASRPGHFDGVTTVVAKLFNIVQPDEAVFGLKDFQQLAIIRRMVEDLCIPVQIAGVETRREADGLAMSSRNGYLSVDKRSRATVLNQTLQWIIEQVESGRRDFSTLESEGKERIKEAGFRPDYLSICNSRNLQPARSDDTEITVLGAMFTSTARLIDNRCTTLN